MPSSKLNENTLKNIIDTLIKNVNPTLIYVFGSAARDELRDDSDIAYLSHEALSNEDIREYYTFKRIF